MTSNKTGCGTYGDRALNKLLKLAKLNLKTSWECVVSDWLDPGWRRYIVHALDGHKSCIIDVETVAIRDQTVTHIAGHGKFTFEATPSKLVELLTHRG